MPSTLDDFYYAQHQLPKPGFDGPKIELDLSESQFDDAIQVLFQRSRAKRRKWEVTTRTATVELSVITSMKLEAVWSAWTAIKEALACRQEAVPVLVLLDAATAKGAFELARIGLSYEMKGTADFGGFSIFPTISGRGGGEFAVSANRHLWKAINIRKPAVNFEA